jgi:hypothetical protein
MINYRDFKYSCESYFQNKVGPERNKKNKPQWYWPGALEA